VNFNVPVGSQPASDALFTLSLKCSGTLYQAYLNDVVVAALSSTKIPKTQAGAVGIDTPLTNFPTESYYDFGTSFNFTIGDSVPLFYDRQHNTDGLDASKYSYLYLDTVNLLAFEEMPASARRYVAVLAARRMSQQAVGAPTLAQFTQEDELIALRTLKREQGQEDQYNIFQNGDVAKRLGWPRNRIIGSYMNNRFNIGR
jgi:hypothetical protein